MSPCESLTTTAVAPPAVTHVRVTTVKAKATPKVKVTVTTKPKSAKIDECLDTVVRGMTWDKVPSLNQANVSF